MALLPVKPGHDSDRKEPSGSHELCLRSRISALPARVAGSASKRILAAPMALSGARPQRRSESLVLRLARLIHDDRL